MPKIAKGSDKMPKEQSAERRKAKEIYDEHNGKISNREIAGILGISEKSISGWKCKDNWTNKERSTPNKNNRSTPIKCIRKKGGQPGNKNATGPPGNQHARRHGLFAKYLPPGLNAIIDEMPEEPLDMLWDQIQIQYANILHAQEIMYVDGKDDKSIDISMQGEDVTAYDIQRAWDKQASNLSAQSRAMKTLQSMIREYDDMVSRHEGAASEEQRARIAQLKAQTKKLEADSDDTPNDGTQESMDAVSGILAQMKPIGDDEI